MFQNCFCKIVLRSCAATNYVMKLLLSVSNNIFHLYCASYLSECLTHQLFIKPSNYIFSSRIIRKISNWTNLIKRQKNKPRLLSKRIKGKNKEDTEKGKREKKISITKKNKKNKKNNVSSAVD